MKITMEIDSLSRVLTVLTAEMAAFLGYILEATEDKAVDMAHMEEVTEVSFPFHQNLPNLS
jgi:pyrroline-5-carboxylate reductase